MQKFNPPKHLTVYTKPPSCWPKAIPYLPQSYLSPSLNEDQLGAIRTTLAQHSTSIIIPQLVVFAPTSNPLVVIRHITNSQHPANGQSGLFAAQNLPPGTHITDYTGHLHSCPDTKGECSTSDYDLAFLDRDAGLAIDGSKMGNEGRFVNDYHGILDQTQFVGPESESKLEVNHFQSNEHVQHLAHKHDVKGRAKFRSHKSQLPTKKGPTTSNAKLHAKVKAGPNAVFEEYFVKARGKSGKEVWEAKMGIWVSPSHSSGIVKGEEICVSYGRGYWKARSREVLESEFSQYSADLNEEDTENTDGVKCAFVNEMDGTRP